MVQTINLLITSSKLSRQQFEFSLNMGSNPGYLLNHSYFNPHILFTPFLKAKNVSLGSFNCKFLSSCMFRIQERIIMASAGYNGKRTVHNFEYRWQTQLKYAKKKNPISRDMYLTSKVTGHSKESTQLDVYIFRKMARNHGITNLIRPFLQTHTTYS